MKRIWFKPDCIEWIRNGKKTTTFRKHQMNGVFKVVTGSRFNAKPANLLIRLTPGEMRVDLDVILDHFGTEGDFATPYEFFDWLSRVKLLGIFPELGWLHRIEVVNELEGRG